MAETIFKGEISNGTLYLLCDIDHLEARMSPHNQFFHEMPPPEFVLHLAFDLTLLLGYSVAL